MESVGDSPLPPRDTAALAGRDGRTSKDSLKSFIIVFNQNELQIFLHELEEKRACDTTYEKNCSKTPSPCQCVKLLR